MFSVSIVYRENYSIPNKPVESAKKLVGDTLPSGFDIHIQISQKNLNKFQEEKSQVLFKASIWDDLKSAVDEPPRKSRKQKLDKWQ